MIPGKAKRPIFIVTFKNPRKLKNTFSKTYKNHSQRQLSQSDFC